MGVLKDAIQESNAKVYDLKYQTTTASVPELQNNLDAKTALLEYFVGDSAIHIFSISKNTFDVISIPKDSAFSQLVDKYYQSVRKGEKAYLTHAHELYKLLIAPVADKIAEKQKLVIIPHDLLYKVPFEALLATAPDVSGENPGLRACEAQRGFRVDFGIQNDGHTPLHVSRSFPPFLLQSKILHDIAIYLTLARLCDGGKSLPIARSTKSNAIAFSKNSMKICHKNRKLKISIRESRGSLVSKSISDSNNE
jgi:hypothetical protein